jgi:3-isopropylmalate dehydrogenase
MKKRILALPGDGVGQEVVPQALRVLTAVAEKFNHSFDVQLGKIGGDAYDQYGHHFPEETKKLCQSADAILLGSVGGPLHEAHQPKWKNCERNSILALRKALNLNVNLRPVQVYPALASICPLRKDLVEEGVDILILRELIGDIYFGDHIRKEEKGMRLAQDVAEYTEEQIQCVARQAFQFALKRRKKIISVDKANVLETSKLWREVVTEIAKEYPDVQLEHMLVDNAAMQLILNPTQFDVLLTANLLGDILSDEAAAIPGSLGLMPSGSLNPQGLGLYEPSGGSAPDIAGKNMANPIAQILSASMMLSYSFGLFEEASNIERAIQTTLEEGFRTRDIYREGDQLLGTIEMTDCIIERL